jgi:hypothetical protein
MSCRLSFIQLILLLMPPLQDRQVQSSGSAHSGGCAISYSSAVAMQQQKLQQGLAQRPQKHSQLLAGRPPRHRTLNCHARRTVSGSSDTKKSQDSPLKRPDSRAGKSSTKATPATVKPTTPQHNSSRGTQGVRRPANQPQRSQIEEFMRTTPGEPPFACLVYPHTTPAAMDCGSLQLSQHLLSRAAQHPITCSWPAVTTCQS